MKKNIFKSVRNRKGMTYVELLVALTLLALVVVIFTPMLMLSYSNLYNAGEITVDTFNQKNMIEKELATRINLPKVPFSLKLHQRLTGADGKALFDDVSDAVEIIAMKIRSAVDGLETMFGVARARVLFVGKDFVNDNYSTQDFGLRFVNIKIFEGIDSLVIKGTAHSRGKVIVNVTSPMNNETVSYSIKTDTASPKIASIVCTGLDTSYSPLKIEVFYYDEGERPKTIVRYLEIKPASIMFVGKSTADVNYYTAELAESAGSLVLEGRKMPDTKVGAAVFNKVRWVRDAQDVYASSGYYVMVGEDGIIRRLWHMTSTETQNYADIKGTHFQCVDNEYYKYYWGGDYTEDFAYAENNSNVVGNNSRNNKELWSCKLTACSAFVQSGYRSNPVRKNTQISSILDETTRIADILAGDNSKARDGIIYKVKNNEVESTTDNTLNWEGSDGYSRKTDDGKIYGVATSNQIKKSTAQKYPLLFFSYNDNFDGIDRMYLCKNNNWGNRRIYSSAKWEWRVCKDNGDYSEFVAKKGDHRGPSHGAGCTCDVPAYFTETLKDTVGGVTKTYAYVPPQNGQSAEQNSVVNQNTIIEFIEDFLLGSEVKLTATRAVFKGDAGDASDAAIAYVRLKAYTNVDTANDTTAFNTLLATNYDDDGVKEDCKTSQNTISLTDVIYVNSSTKVQNNATSGSHVLYTGYMTASALYYTTVPSSSSSAHNVESRGVYKMFTVNSDASGNGCLIKQYETGLYDHVNFKNKAVDSVPTAEEVFSAPNTRFTMGYSSNRDLVFDSPGGQKAPAFETTELSMPDEFKNILKYDSVDGCTVGVGYIISGSATSQYFNKNVCFDGRYHELYPEGGKVVEMAYMAEGDAQRDAVFTERGKKELAFGFFKKVYAESNGVYSAKGNIRAHTYGDDGVTPTQKQAFYLDTYLDVIIKRNVECALFYTGLKKESIVRNRAIITLLLDGQDKFTTIYMAPEGSDYRFTCVEIVPAGEDYVLYIGDSLGRIWRAQITVVDNVVSYDTDPDTAGIEGYPAIVMDSTGTNPSGLTEIKDICVTDDCLIACGETDTSVNTKLIVGSIETKTETVTVTVINPETEESVTQEKEKVTETVDCKSYVIAGDKHYTLYDIEFGNTNFYICGDYASSGETRSGVVLYTDTPDVVNTTINPNSYKIVTTAKKVGENATSLQPLYSVAIQK